MTNKDASCGSHQTVSSQSTSTAAGVTMVVCAGCRSPIRDQYMLHIEPGLDWHVHCLRCVECYQTLDETCTCFVRDGRPYCKPDYNRLFGVKCPGCGVGFDKINLVMRARDCIYHIDCFRCVTCERRLVSGDKFAVRRVDGGLVCSDHYDNDGSPAVMHGSSSPSLSAATDLLPAVQSAVSSLMDVADELCADTDVVAAHGTSTSSSDKTTVFSTNVASGVNSNHDDNTKNKLNHAGNSSPQTSSTSSNSGKKQAGRSGNVSARHVTSRGGKSESHRGGTAKTTRIRTVLNEKQLHTLRTCYAANPRPDALMKDQLVEMTGLSSRVIRVWFQNKRCKDKKRTILIKQLQQQHQDKGHGVPIIASSPVRMQDQNHAMLQVSAVQIHQQYVQHPALSSGSPADVLQPQCSMPLTGGQSPSVSWSTAAVPSCLPSSIADYGEAAGRGTTTSLVLDEGDADMTPSTAAFQQLLDSFGCQSDDSVDDDDDVVVSVDQSTSLRARSFKHQHQQQRLQSFVQPQQHHAVCSAARC